MSNISIEQQADSTEVAGWRVTYDWKIKNFKLLPQKVGEYIESPLFYAGPDKGMWELSFYPQGWEGGEGNHVSLYINLHSSDKLGITVQIEFLLLNSNKVIRQNIFKKKFAKLSGQGWHEFARRSDLITAAETDDSFIIRCTMDFITPLIDEPFNRYQTELSDDLCSLFTEAKFSDVTIIVGDEKFQAHKSILTARSPVFSAMFDHEEMIENIKNEVKIEDMEPVVVRGMLEFLYTGRVDDLEFLATGLLAAAQKYELIGLRYMCTRILKTIIDVENVIEILTLSDLYDIDDLKEEAMSFVKKQFSKVIRTEDYKRMSNYELVKELMCYCVLR